MNDAIDKISISIKYKTKLGNNVSITTKAGKGVNNLITGEELPVSASLLDVITKLSSLCEICGIGDEAEEMVMKGRNKIKNYI